MAMNKNKISAFVTAGMDLKCITLSEVIQSVKETYYSILLIYGI